MAPDWITALSHDTLVYRAYEFAEEAHKHETRESGEPYLVHCIAVADTVRSWGLDDASIASALLHDTLEDTATTPETLAKRFGDEVAFLVSGLTKLKAIEYQGKDKESENLRKFIISFTRDLRVVIIKLADRLHNMQTLEPLSHERKVKLSRETIEVYAPLAYRLGMQKLSGELEDLAFPHLFPEEHRWLTTTVAGSYEERLAYAERIRPMVVETLAKNGLRRITVDARAKRYYSLYKKLQRYDMNLEKIYDLVALRIVVETVEQCYAALGIVHKYWQPLPGQFDDYIARPKPNGYRSIHTTVFCAENRITEFQIRTREMHEENEFGIAAHWAYQQIKSSKRHAAGWSGVMNRRELLWIEQLRNWQTHTVGDPSFLESLKTDFFKERIFVLTPENDVIDLPTDATPVDFAYRIHSKVGDECTAARVNRRIVPLDYILHSGDMVEVTTQRGKKPSEGWLRFVKTAFAKRHIKNTLRASDMKLKRAAAAPPELELVIHVEDRSGLIKDVSTAFADLNISIVSLTSHSDARAHAGIVTVRCAELPKQKIEKLLVKLKKITNVREVRQTLVR